MPRRKKPFSGKAKKAQLQAKRRAALPEENWKKDAALAASAKVVSPETSTTSSNAPSASSGLKTIFAKEPRELVEKRKALATKPLVKSTSSSPYKYGLGRPEMELSFPKRPEWKSLSAEELEEKESKMFKAWLSAIYAAHVPEELNYFEHNLQVWRQLWRTIEKSDVLVLVLDSRFPLLHFSHKLVAYVTHGNNSSNMVLCLNKTDLVPPSVLQSWLEFFKTHFPSLQLATLGAELETHHKRGHAGPLFDAIARCSVLKGGKTVLASSFVFPESNSSDTAHLNREEHMVVGLLGDPNMGKSTLINRMFEGKRVSESATPGHTKHFQTLFLKPTLCFCDCPGIVFPKLKVGREIQVLFGSYPIAQTREPYSAIRYLAEHYNNATTSNDDDDACALAKVYGLTQLEEDLEDGWSPFTLAEAYALKRRFVGKGGKPDVYRGANRMLRDALEGKKVSLWFVPPTEEEYSGKSPEAPAIDLAKTVASSSSDDDSTEESNVAGRYQELDDSSSSSEESN